MLVKYCDAEGFAKMVNEEVRKLWEKQVEHDP